MAVRMGPWKVHFQTKENYYDSIDSFGHLEQRVSWLFQPMNELVGEHLKTLAQYPPVQGGTSFDMSNVVEEFLRRSKQ
jgi:hypothetical protein